MEPVRNDSGGVGLDEWLVESFQKRSSSTRPSVTLSYAQSLDGSIALQKGERLVISGPESQTLTHQLRAGHDAILVGIGTVLSDDPQLTVRLVEGKDPQIVVLDSQLRMPLDAKMLNGGIPRIFCVASADRRREEKLELAGAMVERQTDETATQVNLRDMLSTLKTHGIKSVMVEGGGEIISSFISECFVDRVILTIAPQFIGGYTIPGPPFETMIKLENGGIEKFGQDLVVWGDVKQ